MDNVYLGRRLVRGEAARVVALNLHSALDLTCEFGEIAALRGLAYLCIPVLDTKAPTMAELRDGARWIAHAASQGPVYVHCALGHGRSATFVAAYLLLSDKATTPEEAVRYIAERRPGIGLGEEQWKVLRQFGEAA